MRFLTLSVTLLGFLSESSIYAQSTPSPPNNTRRAQTSQVTGRGGSYSMFSPTTRPGERPVAYGFDGLRTPIDRRYYRTRKPRALQQPGMNTIVSAIDRAAYGPTFTFSTAAHVTPANPLGGPTRYQAFTVQNQNGGQTAIIYDRSLGTTRSVELLTSFGQVYYGPHVPGSGLTPLPVGVSYGNGTGSFSGNALNPSFGNAGPFGTPISITPPVTSTTPSIIVPTYGVTQP